MTRFLIFLIKAYQKTISPDHGCLRFVYRSAVFSLNIGIPLGCRQKPTCSEYAIMSIKRDGVKKGLENSLKRIAGCL